MAKKKRKKKRRAAYQRRDSNIRKVGQAAGKKKQKKYRNPGEPQTFGQKVQKFDGGKPPRGSDVFTGQKVTDAYNEDEKQDVTNPDPTAYARKQTRQPTSGQKVQKSDGRQLPKGSGTFTEQKSMGFRNGDIKQRVAGSASKGHAKKRIRKAASGQKAQKSGRGQPPKGNDAFTGQKATDGHNGDAKQAVTNPDSTAYAGKQTRQPTSGQKVQKSDGRQLPKGSGTFTEQKAMDFLNGDVKQRAAGSASKAHAKKRVRKASSGQKVQKSGRGQPPKGNDAFTGQKATDGHNGDEKQAVTNPDAKAYTRKQIYQSVPRQKAKKPDERFGKEEESDFVKPDSIFKEQNYFSQPKENEKGQADMEGYRCKDTYGQSLKKGGDYKKREREECQVKGKDNGSIFPQKTFSADAGAAIAGDSSTEFIGSEKLQKKQKQAQKASRRVEKARAKLSETREYAQQRVFNKETGKEECTMVPLGKGKPFRQGWIPKSALRRIRREDQNFVHRKVSETEKENSAVEGAHKTEQRGEELFGFVKQQLKGNAQEQKAKVAKLEKRQFKKEVSFRYQKFLEENPQMQKKALQKRLQKQRIKREYIKARRKAATSKEISQAFEKTKNGTVTVARKLQEFAQRNAGLLVSAGMMAMLLMVVMFAVSSCGAMFSDTQSTILAASYLSSPKEIDATELQFTRLELGLQDEIDRVATDHPGYDEYSYSIGGIGHDPFTLINYLSAAYTEFTASGVESEVQALFDEMYTLTLTPDTETRTRTVTRIGTRLVINPITGDITEEIYEYEVEEEYEVTILRVALTVVPLESIVAGKMNTEQAEVFDMYQGTGELSQEFASPLNLYWHPYVSSYYGYRKNPDTGNGELHRGVDIAVPAGTPVYAAHDGTVTAVAYDSHYGNYVVIEEGGYTTKYAHMDSLSVSMGQAVTQGGVIGVIGNAGGSTGSHLHIECLYNGEYYNPLFYFDVGEGTL